MLFTEYAFLDRFDAAAKAGFGAVEMQFPYAFSVAEIRQRLTASGLPLVLNNLPAGDWTAGERGIACHPERVAEFRAGVDLAIEYASALGVQHLNCLAGIAPPGVPGGGLKGYLFTDQTSWKSASTTSTPVSGPTKTATPACRST